MKKKIKLFDPFVVGDEEKYVKSILKSGFWASGAGVGYVSEFEKRFQNYVKCKECVAVNSGTAALHLALSMLDIKNKEVILPSLSFVSTAHAVIYNGGKPIFADVDPKTLCLDPLEVEKKISSNTKVILPVHFGGMPSELDKLTRLAKNSKVTMVEDAAHACGSSFDGKKIGSHSDFVCFSYHPVKNLAMPSGGLVSINKSNYKMLKKTLMARRWCGITNRKDVFYDVREVGWNFYMNEFSAAIGLVQLKKLDQLNKKRIQVAKNYYNKINLEHKMSFSPNCSYHFYWILVKNRDLFRKKMSERGIETGIHYMPIHKMSLYKHGYNKLEVTENISESIVTLPTHPNLTNEDVDYIINTINILS